MNEMIEKVARALCARRTEAGLQRDWTMSLATRPLAERVADYVSNNWTAYQDDARAAIEAMHTPTMAMSQAARDIGPDKGFLTYWYEMIGTALK